LYNKGLGLALALKKVFMVGFQGTVSLKSKAAKQRMLLAEQIANSNVTGYLIKA
jgi:hypothetical protein